MITQYILSQDKQNKVNRLNGILGKLELQCAKAVYENISDEQKIRKKFYENPTVQMLQKEIADTYSKFSTKILITLETEEEIKYFKENWKLKDKTRDIEFDKIPKERNKEIGKNETEKIEVSILGTENEHSKSN